MPLCSFAISSLWFFYLGMIYIFLVSSVNSYFISCRLVVDSVSDIVDYWVTFNEPHVFCMLTYCAGAWPGGHPDMLEVATSALPTGVFQQAMHWTLHTQKPMTISTNKGHSFSQKLHKRQNLNLERFRNLYGAWALNMAYFMHCSTMF
jgi:beta-glucosidase/6-phospho-beta-glucosidase/beta-galactosidase